jgi:outer membrane receptor protein involved in Fe transport
MNTQRGRKTLTVAGAVALALAAAAAGAQTAESTSLGEVIVTAQKRSEALADIPMSVSVVAGDTLERQRVENFEDLAALVPGLSLVSATPGITRVTMRGINTGGVASTVGIYLDDVPFGSSSGLANAAILSGDIDTFDMARVEVLRGPQGTLYGASALGGVIKYVANAPSTAGFEGRLQGSIEDVAGAGLGYGLTGVVNIPMGDSLAVRASGFYRTTGGYIDSIGTGPIPALQDPSVNIVDGTLREGDINDSEVVGGRVTALFTPSEAFSLDLSVHFQDINSDNQGYFEVDPATLQPPGGRRVASRYHNEPTDIEYRLYSATLDWDLGGVSLQSVTSYSEFLQDFELDVATLDLIGTGLGTAQLLTFAYSTPGTTDSLLSGVFFQNTGTDKFTQEFRLVSPESDRFEWLLGAYYTDEDSLIHQEALAVTPATNDVVAGIPEYADVGINSTYEELALFGNATWHVSDRFDLSLGVRWSENDQDASQSVTIRLPEFLIGPPGLIEQNFDNLKSSESPVTWSFSPRYEFSDTTSAYLRVATGFRPGGPNVLPPNSGAPATYDSDELTNYEVGIRTGNESGSFSLDVAAFFLDWEDIQLFQVVNDFGVNANGGTAESKGIEFTATARAYDGLSFSLTGAYIDAELTEDTDPDGAGPIPDLVGGFDGDPLPFVPELTLGLSGDYEWSVFGDSTAYVGAQVSYTGERTAGFADRVDLTDPTSPLRELDSYTTVDLRAGLLRDQWSLELYVKNLGDEDGITDFESPGTLPNGAAGIAVIRPRTYGLALGVRF